MSRWLFMVIPLYFTYYTVRYAVLVWRKEKNLLACLFILLLAASLAAIPIWLRLR